VTSTSSSLGRLSRTSLREIWLHEAQNFTPWLAQPENIALLGATLHLGDLEVEATERNVGRFSADIVARDEAGQTVLIENQLEATDHRHLGQLLTYLAGLQVGATVIWIAAEFLDEHRAAIDWLNANTGDRYSFFGVEIELVRINDSLPAPMFNIAAKPNDWSRGVNYVAQKVGTSALNEAQKQYQSYWLSFQRFLLEESSDFRIVKPPIGYWCGFGRARAGISATLRPQDGRLGVETYISQHNSKDVFRKLEEHKAEIEQEFGEPLSWQLLPERKASRVALYRTVQDVFAEQTWPDQHVWMLDKMNRFYAVFQRRLSAIPFGVE
jgi:hypothetical protein